MAGVTSLRASRRQRARDVLSIAGMVLAGLFFAALGGSALLHDVRARGWPTVEGRVLSAGMNYIPEVPSFELRYEYTVDGRRYEGSSDDVEDRIVDGRSVFSTGATVPVHVDPGHPERSAVEPAFHLAHLGWLLTGLVLAIGGGWLGGPSVVAWLRGLAAR